MTASDTPEMDALKWVVNSERPLEDAFWCWTQAVETGKSLERRLRAAQQPVAPAEGGELYLGAESCALYLEQTGHRFNAQFVRNLAASVAQLRRERKASCMDGSGCRRASLTERAKAAEAECVAWDECWRAVREMTGDPQECGNKPLAIAATVAIFYQRGIDLEAECAKLREEVAHWKKMYECAQNANAFRQDALDGL